MPQKTHIMHGRDHEPHGADPIKFPNTIPGDYEQMALTWADAYWKLEETELGALFLDSLPGHHDLSENAAGTIIRGVSPLGPKEPASYGISLSGGSMAVPPGTEGASLETLDSRLGVTEDGRVGFFGVVFANPPATAIAGVVDDSISGSAFAKVRWAIFLSPIEVPTDPPTTGYNLAGLVNDGGDALGSPEATVIFGSTLLCHPLGATVAGDQFDVAFTYNGSVLKIYWNGQEEATGTHPGWVNETRAGRFVLGSMNFRASATGSWYNWEGEISSANLSVSNAYTSGQIKNMHDGEPTVGGFPGEITPDQHGTIPTGDLHPEYVREAEITGKGDLLAGTGAGTLDELPAGTNGQTLVVDSTEPTGLKWVDPVDPARRLFAQQHGPLPASPEAGPMYRIPYLAGAAVEYTLERASLHLGEAGSTATTLLIEKSETTDEFTPETVATLSCGSGSHLDEETSGLGTLESGNLLRFKWTAVGTGADMFHVQLEGTEI